MEYTVYKHTSPSGKVYIGVTSTDVKRRWGYGSGYNHNEYFRRAIKKYGWDNFAHDILYSGLTKDDAYSKERALIKEYRSNEKEHGYNHTDGGEVGKKLSKEAIDKIREHARKRVGENNPRYGKHCTDETKEKIRAAIVGRFAGKNNPNFGKPMKDEQKKKISESRKGKHFPKLSDAMKKSEKIKANSEKRMKEIHQYTKDGAFVKTWRSAPDAAMVLCGRRGGQSNISSCANGNLGSAYGFVWRYSNNEEC